MDTSLRQGPRPTAPRGRRAPRGLRAWLLLVAAGLAWGLPAASEPKRYDPDTDTCQTQAIRRAYQANLLPWQDQPDVVLQRLRQLQAAMTRDTLREWWHFSWGDQLWAWRMGQPRAVYGRVGD